MREKNVELFEKRLGSKDFSSGVSNTFILCFGAGTCNCRLLTRAPRNQIGAEKDTITTCRTTIVKASSPVSVGEGSEVLGARGEEKETIVCCMPEVA